MADRRIHICHVQTTMNPGGLENGVVNVVNGLDPDRFRSTVICLHHRGPMADRIVNPSAQVISLNHPDRLAPELPFRLARLFRKLQPDVVHTRNYTPNLYGTLAARLVQVPAVVNGEHGQIQLIEHRKKMVSKFMSGFADRILCVSPGLKDFLHENMNYPPGTVDAIINGVNLQRFQDEECDPVARRRELGVPENAWLVGAIGRFIKFKDHPAMLTLLERLPEVAGRPVHALIIGEGDDFESFKEMTRARGLSDRVHLPGFRGDVHRFYCAFDLFCLLSTDNEGTSNVILEAMASGVPVISTEINGNKHLIRSGWNGVLIPPKGESKNDALAGLVHRLLDNPDQREHLAGNARGFVQSRFAIKRMIDDYSEFYSSLVS
jgi:glycosyltransferase involved in cell wall biosynthesis